MIAVIINSTIVIKSDCYSKKVRLKLMFRDQPGKDCTEGWKRPKLNG